MSGPNQARRVTAQIFFQGADITGSMRPYFLSATYTDKEADGTDDLQLKLQDRDDNLIVLFDQEDYEKKSPVLTIVRGSGSYTKHKLNAGTAGTQYASCRVSYTDPGTGKCIEATVKVEDYNDKAKNNQQLEITAKVASVAEAKTKAEKYLRLHNKYAKTATFTLPGNPDIVAGVTAKLTGWGAWDGKYIVEQAAHSVGSSGYTTQVKLRKTLEGY